MAEDGGESVSSREMRRRSFASEGSRAGEAERTNEAKWPQGAAFAKYAKFFASTRVHKKPHSDKKKTA